jgi:hypothetical protein
MSEQVSNESDTSVATRELLQDSFKKGSLVWCATDPNVRDIHHTPIRQGEKQSNFDKREGKNTRKAPPYRIIPAYCCQFCL